MRGSALLVLALLAAAPPARAQPLEPDDQEIPDDTELGPVVTIEAINIRGNTATVEALIRRALPIAPGDTLKQSDKRLRDARFKVLALGYFADVQVEMRKGSVRGRVVIDVTVVERGTFVLNKLWFGHTDFAPYWFGLDVGDRNLMGLGIAAGVGALYAAPSELDGSRAQWAGEARIAADGLRGTRWGAMGSLTLAHGDDTYRFAGDHVFNYRRFGSRFGAIFDATTTTRLSVQARVEEISHTIDSRLARDLWLEPGESRVVTLGLGFDRDTRSDPILPHNGSRISAGVELGSSTFGDYQFFAGFARWEHWFPLRDRRHAIGVRAAGGIVSDGAPRFDRLYASDVNRMLTPRALGLILSDARGFDIVNDDVKPFIGKLGGLVAIEYAAQLFRGKGRLRVYGGDVFVSAGLWGLAQDDGALDHVPSDHVPLDLYVDAGLRIDTDVGIFELTVANALGRVR